MRSALNVQMEDDDELGSKNLSVGRAIVDVLTSRTSGSSRPTATEQRATTNLIARTSATSILGSWATPISARAFAQATRRPDAGEERLRRRRAGADHDRGLEHLRFRLTGRRSLPTGARVCVACRASASTSRPSRAPSARVGWRAGGRRDHRRRVLHRSARHREHARGHAHRALRSRPTRATTQADFILSGTNSANPSRSPTALSSAKTYWLLLRHDAGTGSSSRSLRGGSSARRVLRRHALRLHRDRRCPPERTRFRGSIEGIHQDINLPEGDFEVDIVAARGTVQFSPDLAPTPSCSGTASPTSRG